jgi:hypothetical protein
VNKNIKFFYLFLLFVFLSSLEVSRINIPALFQRRLKTDEKEYYACLRNALPEDATTLFLSQSDGTLDFTKYTQQYISAEYELVPRLLVASRGGPVNIEAYPWVIAFNLPAEDVDTILKLHSLEKVQNCDQAVILKRIP